MHGCFEVVFAMQLFPSRDPRNIAQSVVIVYARSWSGKSLSTVLAISTISSILRRCIYIAKDLLEATNGSYIQTLYGTKCISNNVTNYLLCAPGAARTTHTGRRVRSSSLQYLLYSTTGVLEELNYTERRSALLCFFGATTEVTIFSRISLSAAGPERSSAASCRREMMELVRSLSFNSVWLIIGSCKLLPAVQVQIVCYLTYYLCFQLWCIVNCILNFFKSLN